MNNNPSIKKNFVMNAILTMSSIVFPLISFRYVAGILLPVGTGKVQFVTSVVAYFNMFAQLGIPTYGVRAIAKVRDNKEQLTKTTQELLIINLSLSVLVYAVLFFAISKVPKLSEEKNLCYIISTTIFLSAIGMEWLYKGLEKYSYITIRSIVFKLIAMIAMFLLIHKQSDYVVYGGISVFAASASSVLNLANARKYISLKPVGNYDFQKHLSAVGIFFAMACATTIYTNLDNVMLGFMNNSSEVGLYTASVKVKTVLVSLVTSLGTVLLPRASYYIEHNQYDEFRRVSAKALNFVFVISIPLTVYFILFSKQSIMLLSGVAFIGSVPSMRLIMPTLILIGITNILGIQILVPLGKEKIVLHSEIAGAAVDLIINYLTIPSLGSVGAATGTLVAEFVVLIWQYNSLRSQVNDLFKNIQYKKILISALIASFGAYCVSRIFNHAFLVLCITSLVFFCGYFALMFIQKEELTKEMLHIVTSKFHGLKRA